MLPEKHSLNHELQADITVCRSKSGLSQSSRYKVFAVLSSLKLNYFVGALLVQYSVAAVSTTDHVPRLQRVLCAAVTADVYHVRTAIGSCIHVGIAITVLLRFSDATDFSAMLPAVIQTRAGTKSP